MDKNGKKSNSTQNSPKLPIKLTKPQLQQADYTPVRQNVISDPPKMCIIPNTL